MQLEGTLTSGIMLHIVYNIELKWNSDVYCDENEDRTVTRMMMMMMTVVMMMMRRKKRRS
jgi:hypothetical protein